MNAWISSRLLMYYFRAFRTFARNSRHAGNLRQHGCRIRRTDPRAQLDAQLWVGRFRTDKTLISTFSANLFTLPDASGDEQTTAWWKSQPNAWEATRIDCRDPADAMKEYVRWLKALPGKPVFVAYPAGFDFMFVYWYLIRFAGESPFSHSALDIKTLAMAALGTDYRDSTKRNMPAAWFDKLPHNHVALDDAIGQGIFVLQRAGSDPKENSNDEIRMTNQ